MATTDINNIMLRDAVRFLIEKHGGVRAAARVLKVSAPYVCRLRDGEKSWPSDALLRKLGVQRLIIYTMESADNG